MPRSPRAVVPEKPQETSVWSAVVLMAATVCAFALFSVFLASNHAFTDALISCLPAPGPALRLAHDGIVADQLRILDVRAEHLTLADPSTALVVEAVVVNDATLPVQGLVLVVEGFRDGNKVAEEHSACGKNVSHRLLKGLRREQVLALMRLETPARTVLAPGERMDCQVVLTRLRSEIDEVTYRIGSAAPTADHRPLTSRPSGSPRE